MKNLHVQRAALFLTFLLLPLLGGCAASYVPGGPAHPLIQPRTDLLILDGHSGDPVGWEDMMQAILDADVLIVGEQHDDANGHQVQQSIVLDVTNRWENIALSMEMLDRSEQSIVDDYLADFIDRDKFMELTASTAWRKLVLEYLTREINRKTFAEKILRIGWPDWEINYQPMIDTMKDAGERVIAANAPWARYTKLVTADGFEDIDTMTPAQRRLIEIPDVPEDGEYRERFWDVMVDRDEGEEPDPAEAEAEEDSDAAHMELTDEQVRRSFHSQLMYDATMAGSIADALNDGVGKVIHLVGQFHSDFEGGTVLELRRRAPDAKILTISMQREEVVALREEDADRADFVIYTIPRND